MDPRNFNAWFGDVTEKAGLGRRHPPEARHGAASVLYALGVPIKTISEVLGHATTAVTADICAHVFERGMSEAAEAMAEALFAELAVGFAEDLPAWSARLAEPNARLSSAGRRRIGLKAGRPVYHRDVTDSSDALELAESFGQVARSLLAASGYELTLAKVVELAVETVDACEHCGVTTVDERRVRTAALTDSVPERVDQLQDETGEGPCLDAIRNHLVFRTGSLQDEDRWPKFARRAFVETGVQSVLSVRMWAEKNTFGSLNMYSAEREAFDDHDVALGSLFAVHASVAMTRAQDRDQFEAALMSRDVIGQAKGILMAREDITSEEAFDLLVRASQRMNIKLSEVARRIAEREPPPQ